MENKMERKENRKAKLVNRRVRLHQLRESLVNRQGKKDCMQER